MKQFLNDHPVATVIIVLILCATVVTLVYGP